MLNRILRCFSQDKDKMESPMPCHDIVQLLQETSLLDMHRHSKVTILRETATVDAALRVRT